MNWVQLKNHGWRKRRKRKGKSWRTKRSKGKLKNGRLLVCGKNISWKKNKSLEEGERNQGKKKKTCKKGEVGSQSKSKHERKQKFREKKSKSRSQKVKVQKSEWERKGRGKARKKKKNEKGRSNSIGPCGDFLDGVDGHGGEVHGLGGGSTWPRGPFPRGVRALTSWGEGSEDRAREESKGAAVR